MRLYEIGICLTLYRTVEVPDSYQDEQDIDDYINEHYTGNKTMIEAIDDGDFQIDDFFWHEVGKK